MVLPGGLLWDQLYDAGIEFKILKINRGYAVLPAKKIGDFLVGEEA